MAHGMHRLSACFLRRAADRKYNNTTRKGLVALSGMILPVVDDAFFFFFKEVNSIILFRQIFPAFRVSLTLNCQEK